MIGQLDKDELLALFHKRCSKCGVVKYFGEFAKHGSCAGGVRSQCKSCEVEYRRKNYEENKEKALERMRKYRKENKEKEAERQRKWREENREKVAESARKKYEGNKEKYAERSRKYYEGNKERYAESTRKRRARKAKAAGTHTADQVKARFDYYGSKCIYCGSDENLQIEHRIPLARGGSDWSANLAPACKSCNCSKGTKTETEFKKILGKQNE